MSIGNTHKLFRTIKPYDVEFQFLFSLCIKGYIERDIYTYMYLSKNQAHSCSNILLRIKGLEFIHSQGRLEFIHSCS